MLFSVINIYLFILFFTLSTKRKMNWFLFKARFTAVKGYNIVAEFYKNGGTRFAKIRCIMSTRVTLMGPEWDLPPPGI